MAESTVAEPNLVQPAVVKTLAVPVKPRKKISSLAEKEAALKKK